ncbi:GntR family transcriptional regulator [Streptomyces sp. NPDC055210]
MPESPRRTALYRYFDAGDNLLYIGISNDPDFRWKAHLHEPRRDNWPKLVKRRTIEWHDSREEALAAEEQAIRTERPRCNGKHTYEEAPFDPTSWPAVRGRPKSPIIADLMRHEISICNWPAGTRIPSLRTLAKAAGVKSTSPIAQAVAALKTDGLLVFKAGHGLFVSPRTAAASDPTATTRPLAKPWVGPKLPHDFFRHLGWPG